MRCGGDVVPHVKGLVCNDLEAREQVARRVLGGQGQGQTGEAETGDDAVDVVAHLRDEDDREQRDDDDAQDDRHEPDGHLGLVDVLLVVEADDLPCGRGRVVQKHPGDERDVRHTEELVDERHPLRLRRDDEEREFHAEDDEEDPERVFERPVDVLAGLRPAGEQFFDDETDEFGQLLREKRKQKEDDGADDDLRPPLAPRREERDDFLPEFRHIGNTPCCVN